MRLKSGLINMDMLTNGEKSEYEHEAHIGRQTSPRKRSHHSSYGLCNLLAFIQYSTIVPQPSRLDAVYTPSQPIGAPILEKALRNAQLKFLGGKYSGL